MNDTITEAKIDRYLDITKRALDKLKVVTPERSSVSNKYITT